MGLMDKVKKAATVTAEAAKKGAGQAKDKVEQHQLRKKADENAKLLGYLVFTERTQGVPAGAEADRLVSEISALEAQLAAAEAGDDAGSAAGAAGDPEGPAAGA
jgi:hypothetical protein